MRWLRERRRWGRAVCSPTRDEVGAGTVLGLAMTGVVLFVTLGVVGAESIVATHRAAQSAADLAALAGASAHQRGEDACGAAGQVARANRATLRRCTVDGFVVTVAVDAVTAELLGRRLRLGARGRAGPVHAAASWAASRPQRLSPPEAS